MLLTGRPRWVGLRQVGCILERGTSGGIARLHGILQELAHRRRRHRGAGGRRSGHDHDAAVIQAGLLYLVRGGCRRSRPEDGVLLPVHVRRRRHRGGCRGWQSHRNRADGTPRSAATDVARLHPVTIAAIALATDRLAVAPLLWITVQPPPLTCSCKG